MLGCDPMMAPRRFEQSDKRSGIDLPNPRQLAAEYVPDEEDGLFRVSRENESCCRVQ
jgi:hypothetical protein